MPARRTKVTSGGGETWLSTALRPPEKFENEVSRVLLESEEAAFMVGTKGGQALLRIAQASGAIITTTNFNQQLDIHGDALARKRATKYVDFVISQMDGVFRVDDEDFDSDCSIVEVPDSMVGFVTGGNGKYLRHIEKRWGVVMFFAEYNGKLKKPFDANLSTGRTETLLIFGQRRPRRGAQLAAMGVVEEKIPRFYSGATRRLGEMYEGQWCYKKDSADWGTTTMEVKDGLIPYLMGKNGSAHTKLMLASGAVIFYVGNLAYISGTQKEQTRGREYLTWILNSLDGPVEVPNLHRRTDATTVMVPQESVGYITGGKRATLTKMEEEWGVLMLFLGEHGQRSRGSGNVKETVPLLVLGISDRARKGAEIDTMNLIEFRQKGFATQFLANKISSAEGFDVDYWHMTEVEVGYACGSNGSTRRKIAAASGVILNFVGFICCIGGTRVERARCRDYLEWLLQQMRNNNEAFVDTRGRDDVTEVELRGLKNKAIGVVAGHHGTRLRKVEQQTKTWCLIAKDHKGMERLCIFSKDAGSEDGETGRQKAETLFRDALHQASVIQIRSHQKSPGTGNGRGVYSDQNHDDGYMNKRSSNGWSDAWSSENKSERGRTWSRLSRRSSRPWQSNSNGDWNKWKSWDGDWQAWKSKTWDKSQKPRGRSWDSSNTRGRDAVNVKEEKPRSRSPRGKSNKIIHSKISNKKNWERPDTSSTRSPSTYSYSSRESSPESARSEHYRPSPPRTRRKKVKVPLRALSLRPRSKKTTSIVNPKKSFMPKGSFRGRQTRKRFSLW